MSEIDRNVTPRILVCKSGTLRPFASVAYIYEDHILLCISNDESTRRKDIGFGKLIKDSDGEWCFEIAQSPHGTVLCSNRFGRITLQAMEGMMTMGVIAGHIFDNGDDLLENKPWLYFWEEKDR